MPETIVWVDREIAFDSNDKSINFKTVAKCSGPLAIHKGVDTKHTGWCVTCRSIGYIIVEVDEEADAQKIAALLLRRCRGAFMETTKKAILDRLPKWVAPWIKSCQIIRGYESPPVE